MVDSNLHLPKPIANPLRLKCLRCSTEMERTPAAVTCRNCEQSWLIKDGIPRFFQPSYYWGEVTQEHALSILEEVRRLGWREAATHRFKCDPDLLATVIGNQRLSWFPLLGLGADSVALDIGSGYGAITHALSYLVGQVYSLEAIPERVEFTRLRLSQERIQNVHQIQATALDPPFCDESFDLIVVNGVLEWVGEWDQNRGAREVQLRFLRKLAQLLKRSGVLVIGIENRFGYSVFRDRSFRTFLHKSDAQKSSQLVHAPCQPEPVQDNLTRQARVSDSYLLGARIPKAVERSGDSAAQFFLV